MSLDKKWDVVVVGAGNAAFCAALAAREKGARVLMLERAPQDLSGGSSRFTAGAMRFDGTGLTSGAVFGRIAGTAAGAVAGNA
jgi:succinate dehydrogenase/fumarate reductase flavoprotein subunit